MSNPLSLPTRARFAAGRKRYPVRATLKLETLEGRALLSHVHALATPNPNPPPTEFQRQPNPHPGPILNEIGNGFAVKSLRIYPYYTGVKRPELDAAAARAFLDRQGDLVLTASLGGPVNQAPTSAGQEAFYVWGINRGTAAPPGPFAGRPNITFDSAVVVAVTRGGISTSAVDLNTGQSLTLDPSSTVIVGDNIHVFVPLSSVAPGNLTPSTVPTVNFWARSASPQTSDLTSIESFVPEFRNFPISLGAAYYAGHRRGLR